jgi:fumarylacetoacetase
MTTPRKGLNATHEPQLRSWLESANQPSTDFPIQNLPFGVFRRAGVAEPLRCGVAIGDQVLDMAAVAPLLEGAAVPAALACRADNLNALMGQDALALSAMRLQLSGLLRVGAAADVQAQLQAALVPLEQAELVTPVKVAGFTDFFASIHHATHAGSLFRPDNPLLPNYKHVPIAYNGRANSVRCTSFVQRPVGQLNQPGAAGPVFAPSERLDYEVELGAYIGTPSKLGQPVSVAQAWEHIFGFSLLNDWSARDIQAWEYQPLGPFLAKTFATSVAPWVITAEALAPFRTALMPRGDGPAPLPYLYDAEDQVAGALAIQVEAHIRSARMRELGLPAMQLSRSQVASLYWSFGQMVAHHTSNGSALDVGDLLGSGTISGPTADALGCLLEITEGGRKTLSLPSGEERRFLQDGDEVVMRGFCERDGFARIGFGECRATITPSHVV